MKYRIKIITYVNGNTVYLAQYRKWLCWVNIRSCGETALGGSSILSTCSREQALQFIDIHYSIDSHCKIKSIEFQYITK